MPDRTPGQGRYAHLEREQRWLAGAIPAGAQRWAGIEDRYLDGTRLRLRAVLDAEGGRTFKLGQKVRLDPNDPHAVKLTNIYLSAQEHAVLAALPAAELVKTRWRIEVSGRTIAVDELHGRHAGILVAEVELADGEPLLPMPAFAIADVTHDDRYSGGALACASDADLAELLPR